MGDGQHAGQLELVDGQVGGDGSLQGLVLGPELLPCQVLPLGDGLHGGHGLQGVRVEASTLRRGTQLHGGKHDVSCTSLSSIVIFLTGPEIIYLVSFKI